jgi:hypothetical protein
LVPSVLTKTPLKPVGSTDTSTGTPHSSILNIPKKKREGDNTILEIPPTILSLEGETLTKSAVGRQAGNPSETNNCMFEIENPEFLEKQALSNSSPSGNSCSTEKRDNAKGSNLLLNLNEFPPLLSPTSSPLKLTGPVSLRTLKLSVPHEQTTPLYVGDCSETDKEKCPPSKDLLPIESQGATGIGDYAVPDAWEKDKLGIQSGPVSSLPQINGYVGKINLTSEAQSIPPDIDLTRGNSKEQKQAALNISPDTQVPQKVQVEYNASFHCKVPSHAPQASTNYDDIDKPMLLKQGQKRNHIHRYDMRISVAKAKDEEEELTIIRKALQKFFELLLQADATIIIPPFYEVERSDKSASDLSSKFQVADLDSIVALKRYFARMLKVNDKGFVYRNVILAHSLTFLEIMDKLRQIFNDLKFGL